MADIELVIKIPEEIYKNIQGEKFWLESGLTLSNAYDFIKNGTVLPKGHGRLMILSENKLKENQINLDFSCQEWISEVGLSNATVTIIEADKADSEDKE